MAYSLVSKNIILSSEEKERIVNSIFSLEVKQFNLSDVYCNINNFPKDRDFLEKMDITREISSAGLGIRKSNNIRVRQPLGEITIAGENIEWIKEYENYILDNPK